ncbi:MAG: cupin domain-containing protein [Chloroflexi bacterium]|nr:cupin domain-containing protein [Chloroflexota bacterium]
MAVIHRAAITPEPIAPRRGRYLTYTDHLMMVVVEFGDGPANEPDPPHSHPHEQVTYVAQGEVYFFIEDVRHKLGPGDMITVPPDAPHSIQLITPTACLVDTFTPLREDFLK